METEFSESRRGQVIERINQHLQALDYQTLLKLDELTEQVEADRQILAAEEMTRRRFLQGALIGGLVGTFEMVSSEMTPVITQDGFPFNSLAVLVSVAESLALPSASTMSTL